MADKKSIYDLKLHETTTIDEPFIKIMRVPKGWIYTNTQLKISTFVKYIVEAE